MRAPVVANDEVGILVPGVGQPVRRDGRHDALDQVAPFLTHLPQKHVQQAPQLPRGQGAVPASLGQEEVHDLGRSPARPGLDLLFEPVGVGLAELS
ncbi:hypothetical protein [Geochorda subterranea]|uniref:Uncharacterized protein n=1 Tax=Geochorda subterranea TaxID=3109564 RepID=A0ABZ1BSG2_9FIRM|nr:hypothetical protein [Limnochorda sp. LNt]WRP15762.1 hypothetical protein VLY81_06305 [Limnochorda sp. LNt]